MSEFGPTEKFEAATLILRPVNAKETIVDDARAVLGPVSVELADGRVVLGYDEPIFAAPFRALQVLACDCEPYKRPMVRIWARASEWLCDIFEPEAVLLVACDFIESLVGSSRNHWSHELACQDLAELDLTPAIETAARIVAMDELAKRGVL